VRFLRYHGAVERRIVELGVGHVFVRPNLFFQGLLAFSSTVREQGKLYAPAGDARVSAVDVADIAAVAAEVFMGSGHEGATYTVTGPESLTHADMAAALGSALGRDIGYVAVEPEDFRKQLDGALPPWQAVKRTNHHTAQIC
jgi:uncharacterized protein YbjT (DUF2867 family)